MTNQNNDQDLSEEEIKKTVDNIEKETDALILEQKDFLNRAANELEKESEAIDKIEEDLKRASEHLSLFDSVASEEIDAEAKKFIAEMKEDTED